MIGQIGLRYKFITQTKDCNSMKGHIGILSTGKGLISLPKTEFKRCLLCRWSRATMCKVECRRSCWCCYFWWFRFFLLRSQSLIEKFFHFQFWKCSQCRKIHKVPFICYVITCSTILFHKNCLYFRQNKGNSFSSIHFHAVLSWEFFNTRRRKKMLKKFVKMLWLIKKTVLT